MSKTVTIVLALAVGLAAGIPLGGRLMTPPAEARRQRRRVPRSAPCRVPLAREDISGPYEVVEGWPKDLSTLPGHEKWTYGGARGIFAESPNRVYLLGGGELPNIPRPQTRLFPEIGPNVQFPVAGLPWRNANTAAPPGGGGSGQDPAKGMEIWRGASPPYRELGVDARWEHCLVVVDAQGNIIEEWTQWDKHVQASARRLHQPLRSEKHVWVVDDHMHAIYKFTQRRQAARADDRHAERAGRRRRRTSTGRRSWPGCPTAASSSPTATTARASRSSTRTASSCWTAACKGEPGEGNAAGLHEQRARRRRRPRDAARVRQRSRQPPHPDLRRERQVPLRVEDRRQPVEPPLRPDRRGPERW